MNNSSHQKETLEETIAAYRNNNKKKNKNKKKLQNMIRNVGNLLAESNQSSSGSAGSSNAPVRNVGRKFPPPISVFEEVLHSFVMPASISLSPVDPAIKLNGTFLTFSPTTCKNLSVQDVSLLNSSIQWHMVMVLHQERADRSDLVKALYEVVKHDLFAPFGYVRGHNVDFFIVYNQSKALKKLFDNGLIIPVKDAKIPLVVKLGVASVATSHPTLVSKMVEAISERQVAMNLGGAKHLDLSGFSELMLSKGITISLANKLCLGVLFDQINCIEQLKTSCYVYRFANNSIRTLEPFTKLFSFSVSFLDLRNNEINDSNEFHFLKHLEIKELLVDGNYCSKIRTYRDKIFDIIPSLVRIDAVIRPTSSTELPTELNQKPIIFGKGANKFRNGVGNDPIPNIEDGILIRRNPRKRLEFTRVKDIFQNYRNDATWTQVSVQHDNALTREQIFDEVVEKLVSCQPFFPCYYKRYGVQDEFYLYKNFEAINQLMIVDLEHIFQPSMKKIVFTLRLDAAKFQHGQVDWFYKINHVLSKKIKNNVLDISEFVNDPEFEKMVVPMNSKFTLNFLVENAKKQNGNISKIIAQNNRIKSLVGLQSLHILSKLEVLDLRNNLISSLDGINQTSSITELLLDGNPICEQFQSPHAYVSEVCKHFPHLEWLDGHRVNSTVAIATLQNFLVTRDAYTVGEEFVKTFFPIYDSFERDWLMQIYESKAIFTLSSLYNIERVHGQSDAFQRIQKYTRYSRNLKFMANLMQACEKVVVGVSNIGHLFSELPNTNHDLKSFCIDVPVYDPHRMVIITVSGVFEEPAQTLNGTNFLLGFTRTFVLVPAEGRAYNIANDQLFVHDPPFQAKMSLQSTADNKLDNICKDLMPTEIEEKTAKLIIFQRLTELKKAECIQQLEESFWDIKVALATFNTLMDSNDISDNKFDFK